MVAGQQALPGMVARSGSGETYTIGSEMGQNWVRTAQPGETMDASDGSHWTKNPDGSVSIKKNGKNYHFSNGGLVDQYGTRMAQSISGDQYTLGSYEAHDFLQNQPVGSFMTGGDGSIWYKDPTGTVHISQNGKEYTIQGVAAGVPELEQYVAPIDTEQGAALWSRLQDLDQGLRNYQPFSYDPSTDPLYMQYADSYSRNGQRAMKDVLGQLAARTGGIASSYAGAMAQQTYNDYMADLAGKIPELQQLAYSMYVDDYNRAVGDYERAYNRFGDYSDQYNQNYQMGLNAYNTQMDNLWKGVDLAQRQAADARSDYYQGRQWAAQMAQNELENQRYEREYADQRADTQADRAIQAKSQLINMVQQGYIPTQEDAVLYGLTPTELAQYQKWANERNRQENSRYYGYYGY